MLCELIPGGVPQVITANRADAILRAHQPDSPAGQAWHDLPAEHLADLRRIDAHLREVRTKITAAVRASGTTLTQVFGVGPVIAAAVIGDVGDPARFPTADRFASYNGTAPIEVSSGRRKIYRLSQRGNRRLNHAIHMAAVTQIAHKNSQGRGYYLRKIAEGKAPAEARRALKRKISNTIYARLRADARHLGTTPEAGPGGQPGNDSASRAAGSNPDNPPPAYARLATAGSMPAPEHSSEAIDKQKGLDMAHRAGERSDRQSSAE